MHGNSRNFDNSAIGRTPLKIMYGGSFLPSANAFKATVKRFLSCPVVLSGTDFAPTCSKVLALGIFIQHGVSSMFAIDAGENWYFNARMYLPFRAKALRRKFHDSLENLTHARTVCTRPFLREPIRDSHQEKGHLYEARREHNFCFSLLVRLNRFQWSSGPVLSRATRALAPRPWHLQRRVETRSPPPKSI